MKRKNTKVERSVHSKSMTYALIGFLLTFWLGENVVIAILTGLILYKVGIKIIKPSPEKKPRTAQHAHTQEESLQPFPEELKLEFQAREILKRLDQLNFRIADLKVHNLINDIQSLSYKIIQAIKGDSNEETKFFEFVTYYLPALENVTKKYMALVENNIESTASKDFMADYITNLEETKFAFNSLLENLYKDDIDEAYIEMEVLKSTLKSKGLLDKNDFNL